MLPQEISPYIRVAWDSIVPGPFFLDRVIYDYELLYVKDGQTVITIEDKVYIGTPGDLFLFKPNQRHSVLVREGETLHQPHIHFDLIQLPDSPQVKVCLKLPEQLTELERTYFREDLCSALPFELPNYIQLRNPQFIEKMIMDIIHEDERKIPFTEYALKGLFIQLWTYLLREVYWMNHAHIATNWEQLMQVKAYLNTQNQSVTIDELASMVNLNKYYLIKIFRNAFGITPIKYHLNRRIEKAKEQIQFTTASISAISEMFGFQSIHAFSRSFRNIEGVAPSYFRKNGWNQNSEKHSSLG